ncbi:MAG: nucleoside kinase [Candidatus Bipolaricaulota bacterium]
MDHVKPSSPRDTAQVRFPDGRVFEGAVGTPLAAYTQAAYPDAAAPPVAGVIGGELKELSSEVNGDAEVRPTFVTDSEGIRIYTRSLSFLLVAAAREVCPGARLVVDHSVPFGGYYCRVLDREPLSAEELSALEARMRRMVEQDLPIVKEHVPKEDACRWFAQNGAQHKADLFGYAWDEPTVPLYRLGEARDYLFGALVPSTGYLRYFSLVPYHDGFILRFPRRERPTELRNLEDYSALWQVFQEYVRWLELLGVYDAWTVNEAAASGRLREVILVSEALHELRVGEVARRIGGLPEDERRIVLIAGPTSAGKTTFTKRLAVQLLAQGLRPYPVAMDDYFLPRKEMARRGLTDFDHPSAVDLPLFQQHVEELLQGKLVQLPRFDFPSGERQAGQELRLGGDAVLLVEGLHCLNPELLPGELGAHAFRIYVSALTQLKLDDHVRLSTTDTRLIRRMVRDVAYRGYTAEDTLRMWANVRRAEKRNVFPYQGRAHMMFNSALAYEWSVLRPLVEPLLRQVRHPRHRLEAQRILETLRWFKPYPKEEVPATSVLREFIGGGILVDYFPSPEERAARRRR